MNEIIKWVIPILETDDDILVPSKKLWTMYITDHPSVSLEEFTRTLEQDERVEFLEGIDPTDDLDLSPDEMAEHIAEMEALGFFGGPRVKLKDRAITREHIAKMLKKHTDNMLTALWGAFDVRPENLDQEQDAELLELIARAKELQLKMQEMLPPPETDAEKKET
jgi:hypothetical protein